MSTYTPIASVTLSSAGSSVIFSSIPQTYTDLRLVINGNLTSLEDIGIRFNGDSNSNYSYTGLSGNGSTVTSNRQSSQTYMYVGSLDGSQSMTTYDFMNYSKNTMNKTIINRTSAANWVVYARVGLWRSTAEVTSISLTPLNNFASGTTFNLYGIANASITNTAKATGGDSITTDGTYWYHTFLSSGTFTPTQALTSDCLVIAGGGGGGDWASGGGGAGGVSYQSSRSLIAQNYTVTIGAGGAQNNAGSNSVFDTITSNGGGRGGTNNTPNNGGSGGSGGGGAISGTGGSPNQGNTGGAIGYGNAGGSAPGVSGEPWPSAGGGGAGGAGSSISGGTPGAGGIGITNTTINTLNAFGSATSTGQLSGGNYYYAGGGGGASSGGGATGGLGGGGAGANSTSVAGTAGTANTGGGGGGQRQAYQGGAGGSGIIIIRYAV